MNYNSHLPSAQSSVQSPSRDGNYQVWDAETEQSLIVGEFELWFQPVYQAVNYEVVHNEVLLRWRDTSGKMYLPDEFMPVLSDMGLLSQVDRYVIGKAIDELIRNPNLSLSINLSKLALADITLLQDLRNWLRESQVEAQRLSFEIPEATIAQDFSNTLSFIRGLTALGCLVVIDNFTSRELTLSQCKQIPVDSVKLDRQFVEQIITHPNHPGIAKRLREISYTMGLVNAKYITDEQHLQWVQALEIDGVQGNLLQSPNARPLVHPWKSATVVSDDGITEEQWSWDEWTKPESQPIQTEAVAAPKPVAKPPQPVTKPQQPTVASVNFEAAKPEESALAPVQAKSQPPVPVAKPAPANQAVDFKPVKSEESALSRVDSTPAPPVAPVPAPKITTTAKPLPPSLVGKKPSGLQRLMVGTACVGLGVAVIGVAFTSIWHRMSHMVVKHGVVNGRLVRLQSPLYGNVKEFYARPGAMVQADQVLARIEHIPDENRVYDALPVAPVVNLKPELPEFENPLNDYRRYNQLEELFHDAEQDIVKFRGQLQAKQSQLTAAENAKSTLESRLQEIEQERAQLKTVEVNVSATEIPQRQADLNKATAQENLARNEYERFRQLQVQGAVPAQRVDELLAAWETAKADVQRAREELRAAEVNHNATQSGVAMNLKYSNTLAQEAADVKQKIQHQTMLVSSLSTEVENARQQLTTAQNLYNQRQRQMQEEKGNIEQVRQQKEKVRQEQERIRTEYAKQQQEQALAQQQASQPNLTPLEASIKAPFTSVVYKTEREKGELVNKSEAIVSLLDCNTLWVEAVVSAEDASRLDTKQPVHVRLSNHAEVFEGEIDLIQPISTVSASNGFAEIEKEGRRMQVQALSPTIPADLMREPFLKRVTVKVPPNPNNSQPQQLCGLGQVAQLTFAKQGNGTMGRVVSATRQLPTQIKNQFVGWFTPLESEEGVVSRPEQK